MELQLNVLVNFVNLIVLQVQHVKTIDVQLDAIQAIIDVNHANLTINVRHNFQLVIVEYVENAALIHNVEQISIVLIGSVLHVII